MLYGNSLRKTLVCRGISAPQVTAECQADRGDEFSERPGCAIKGMGLETASKLCLIRSIAGVSRALMGRVEKV